MPLELLELSAKNIRLWSNNMGRQLWICCCRRHNQRRFVPKLVYALLMEVMVLVDEKNAISSGLHDTMCPASEMAVVWTQNQLRHNQTQDLILNYVNELCERLPSPMGESSVECGSISMPNVSFNIG